MTTSLPEETFGIVQDGNSEESFIDLNAKLNLYDSNGLIQFDEDREAARQYFLQHVNPNTVYFTDLEEKLDYLIDHGYYDEELIGLYDREFIVRLLKDIYALKYRFPTLISALKFYNQYALKTKDGKRYLERYEDRVVLNGLYLGRGDTDLATDVAYSIIEGRFQPATPTFLNAGIKNRGLPISCFPAGTMVTMEGGERKPIESIAVGDRVVTHSGDTKAVYKVIENDNDRKMVTIKPSLSPAVTMTENHPVLVWREEWDDDAPINMDNNVPDDNFRWIEAGDIEMGKDYVLMPRQTRHGEQRTIDVMDYVDGMPAIGRVTDPSDKYSTYVYDESDGMIKYTTSKKQQQRTGRKYSPRIKPVKRFINVDEDFGRFMGYYLSEGYTSTRHVDNVKNSVVFTLGEHEKDFIDDIVGLCESIFGIKPAISVNSNDHSCKISVNSVFVANIVFDIMGTGYNKKLLSSEYYHCNDDFIRGLLIGAFRGDGCTFEDKVLMDLVNPQLVRQLHDLSISIGLTPGMRDYKNQSGNRTTSLFLRSISSANYDFIIDVAKNLSRFHEPSKPKRINNFQHRDGHGMLSRILGKETSSPVDKVYNLEVEEDHSYLAEGISVHNCFLLNTSDNLESISRSINDSLQLSKHGGGVGICITNLREEGAPIKGIENAASGVVPVMKLYEDSFSYANQLGARQGAGAVYISCHHPDIMKALDTKRENADEKIRIKTLSIGVVVSDKAFQLARENKDMYLFSPYDVEQEYGVPMTSLSISEHYDDMVGNPKITKKKVNARKFFQTVAELQFESGYPYILFEDIANRFHYIDGERISYSNLCVTGDTEILTPEGYIPMIDLWNKHGQLDIDSDDIIPTDFTISIDPRTTQSSSNGMVDALATRVVRTSKNAPVMQITTSTGHVLNATPWHKMFTLDENDEVTKRAVEDLSTGDRLLVSSGDHEEGFVYDISRVEEVIFVGNEDVYDVQVPVESSIVFNGIATGNCSEILQTNELSTFKTNGEYDHVGRDISCNLASINVANAMIKGAFKKTIETGLRALTTVTNVSDVEIVPSVKRGNELSHSVGLGAMNLHGFLGSEKIAYGSDEGLDFTNVFFATMRFHALSTSCDIARETGRTFHDFDKSGYVINPDTGHSDALEHYVTGVWETHPHTDRVAELFNKYDQWYPTREDWVELEKRINEHGLYHAYTTAIAPTGSISYVTHSTSSIHPIVSPIEVRKESKLGRVYSPAYGLRNDNLEYYVDAYELGYQPVIDTYAVAQKHIDQAISATLFYKNTHTTRDVNKAYTYAFSRDKVKNEYGEVALYDPRTSWKSGMIKTLYYARVRATAISGTESEGCVSCAI